jgi:hypothetical protein
MYISLQILPTIWSRKINIDLLFIYIIYIFVHCCNCIFNFHELPTLRCVRLRHHNTHQYLVYKFIRWSWRRIIQCTRLFSYANTSNCLIVPQNMYIILLLLDFIQQWRIESNTLIVPVTYFL